MFPLQWELSLRTPIESIHRERRLLFVERSRLHPLAELQMVGGGDAVVHLLFQLRRPAGDRRYPTAIGKRIRLRLHATGLDHFGLYVGVCTFCTPGRSGRRPVQSETSDSRGPVCVERRHGLHSGM
jgi:hypothetical protein